MCLGKGFAFFPGEFLNRVIGIESVPYYWRRRVVCNVTIKCYSE